MYESSHIYDESEWSLMISLILLLDSRVSMPLVVLSGNCAAHALFTWTACCSNQSSPNEARFRDGSFDRWDVDQAFSVGWRVHHAFALSKSVENHVV